MSSLRSPGRPNAGSWARIARVNTLLLALLHGFAPAVKALPLLSAPVHLMEDEDLPKSPDDASLWIYLSIAIALVLLGGVFAGLTIA